MIVMTLARVYPYGSPTSQVDQCFLMKNGYLYVSTFQDVEPCSTHLVVKHNVQSTHYHISIQDLSTSEDIYNRRLANGDSRLVFDVGPEFWAKYVESPRNGHHRQRYETK